jgi:hypothetical protein
VTPKTTAAVLTEGAPRTLSADRGRRTEATARQIVAELNNPTELLGQELEEFENVLHDATYDLGKVMQRIVRPGEDDRFLVHIAALSANGSCANLDCAQQSLWQVLDALGNAGAQPEVDAFLAAEGGEEG